MINKVTLIGRLGKDPEVRTLESGSRVANFSLATSEKFKDKSGEKKEETQWHNIQAWGKLVDIIEKYLSKGDLIYLEGKIKYRQWESEEGTKYITEIVAYSMQMLGSKQSSEAQTDAEVADQSPTKPQPEGEGTQDDLPF